MKDKFSETELRDFAGVLWEMAKKRDPPSVSRKEIKRVCGTFASQMFPRFEKFKILLPDIVDHESQLAWTNRVKRLWEKASGGYLTYQEFADVIGVHRNNVPNYIQRMTDMGYELPHVVSRIAIQEKTERGHMPKRRKISKLDYFSGGGLPVLPESRKVLPDGRVSYKVR